MITAETLDAADASTHACDVVRADLTGQGGMQGNCEPVYHCVSSCSTPHCTQEALQHTVSQQPHWMFRLDVNLCWVGDRAHPPVTRLWRGANLSLFPERGGRGALPAVCAAIPYCFATIAGWPMPELNSDCLLRRSIDSMRRCEHASVQSRCVRKTLSPPRAAAVKLLCTCPLHTGRSGNLIQWRVESEK